jgi:hypothetical protein
LNWFQAGVNAAEAVTSEEYLGERINLGADYRRAHDIINGILSYARTGG